VSDEIRPEDQLRRVRERARLFFEQLSAEETAPPPAEAPALGDPADPLGADQLSLFLRSLNSHLRSAIAEVRASSKDLAELAAEVRRAEARAGRGD
jgi:hypothetical protein